VGGFVSLTNRTAAPVSVTVQAIGSADTELAPQLVEVPAHGTELLDLDALARGMPHRES
jgi:hypothetical protein